MLDSISQTSSTNLKAYERSEHTTDQLSKSQKHDVRLSDKTPQNSENVTSFQKHTESFGPAVVSHLKTNSETRKDISTNPNQINTISDKTHDRVSLSLNAVELSKLKNQKEHNAKLEPAQAQLNDHNIISKNELKQTEQRIKEVAVDNFVKTETSKETAQNKEQPKINETTPATNTRKSLFSFLATLQNRILGRAVFNYEQTSLDLPSKGSRLSLKV
ncbi:hypothetical protein [Desulfovibrio litoralis]|uniref:Uncharacterized protein n=1 Tax=Desulfovibrio litoralis DSM 11393 TaxID=1121455 RepID=A0A1M7RVZ2_9BACT|nr:hypothetical protein [Desulfovibrio litoralis]SHN50336.1 hypothetical protein SAMN02745728_00232 [Desulfovibrio litoralis DSM 11393]